MLLLVLSDQGAPFLAAGYVVSGAIGLALYGGILVKVLGDRGEQVLAAARREAREESGLEIELHGLVDIYSYAGRAPIIIVYAASMTGGALAIDDESLEARLFARDEIPWDDLAFRSTFEALKDYVTRHWF